MFKEFDTSTEILVGRNYYHFTDGLLDNEQPIFLTTDLSDCEGFMSEDDEEYLNEDDEYNYNPDLPPLDLDIKNYIPSDCWIKRICISENDAIRDFYSIVLTVENNIVKSYKVLSDSIVGPLNNVRLNHLYEEITDYPSEILNEIKLLKKGRYLPNNATFIDKRLPKAILKEGGNGGDMTEHVCFDYSPFRFADLDLLVSTDEDGIIEEFELSTIDLEADDDNFDIDRHYEIVHILLYIIDKYTDNEYKRFLED